jgi:hypothetical protein
MKTSGFVAAAILAASGVVDRASAQSICSFAAERLVASSQVLCTGIYNPWGNVEYTRTYDVYGHLICPGGNPQFKYGNQTVTTKGTGQCGLSAGYPAYPSCPPNFLEPVRSGSSGSNHWWYQDVVSALWFSGGCIKSNTNRFNVYIPKRTCSDAWCAPPPTCRQTETCPEPNQYFDIGLCRCVRVNSPIIFDVAGNGYHLAGPDQGVLFDFDGDGTKERVAWTAAGEDDAFLVLDRDGNGTIDAASELFGNWTPLSNGGVERAANGFEALAALEHGSYGLATADGVIDARDAAYTMLRVWTDRNHDGLSQPGELRLLEDAGLVAIETNYREAERRDGADNRFRQRSTTWWRTASGAVVPRFAYDVWLAPAASTTSARLRAATQSDRPE